MLKQRGFSLVELMVVVVIASVLLAYAVPAFSAWLTNTRIRNVTTEFVTGLQQARAEAIARNSQVRFQSVNDITSACSLSTSGTGWVINRVATGDTVASACNAAIDPTGATAPFIIAKHAPDSDTRVAVAASSSELIFTSLGRRTTTAGSFVVPTADATYDFTASSSGGCAPNGNLTCLRVVVSVAGQVRMCNPRFPADDPQACPVAP